MDITFDDVIRIVASIRTDLNKARCVLVGLVHTELPQFNYDESDSREIGATGALLSLGKAVECLNGVIDRMNAVPKEERE